MEIVEKKESLSCFLKTKRLYFSSYYGGTALQLRGLTPDASNLLVKTSVGSNKTIDCYFLYSLVSSRDKAIFIAGKVSYGKYFEFESVQKRKVTEIDLTDCHLGDDVGSGSGFGRNQQMHSFLLLALGWLDLFDDGSSDSLCFILRSYLWDNHRHVLWRNQLPF